MNSSSSSSGRRLPPVDTCPILVIGAGVLGLSTASLAQSRFPHRKVVLLAAEFPFSSSPTASYASAWAGAHYRPIFSATPQLRDEFKLAASTFDIMRKMAEDLPEAGVKLVQGVEYLDCPGAGELSMQDGDVYAGLRDGFRILRAEELVKGAKWGCQYETYCVNVPVYGKFLLDKFKSSGGIMIVKMIGDAMEAFEVVKEELGLEIQLVVNCSGSNFGHDPKMKIIRGQTCLVKNPYHRTVTRQYQDGRWATLIPRPLDGGTIIGVSKEIGDEEETPRPETRHLLLRQSIECFPDFVRQTDDFEIICDNVGRRPFREGGLRIEAEEFDEGKKRILHGYGAGGRGYELSWGIAQRLVQLLAKETS